MKYYSEIKRNKLLVYITVLKESLTFALDQKKTDTKEYKL